MMLFFLGSFGFYLFFISSMHSLLLLLCLEVFILLSFYLMLIHSFNWFTCLMFLLVGVCLGAYGVSLMVSNTYCKSSSFLFSFKY